MEEIISYYKALANQGRLAVFLQVAKESEGFAPEAPKPESCVTEIAKVLNMAQPTVSNHLKVLEKAGLIKSIKVGTSSYQYITKHATQILLKHSQYIFEQAHKNPY